MQRIKLLLQALDSGQVHLVGLAEAQGHVCVQEVLCRPLPVAGLRELACLGDRLLDRLRERACLVQRLLGRSLAGLRACCASGVPRLRAGVSRV
jgi:hypothetical protein